ncbi:hypothetical protein ACIOHE_38935 [Streptomyces sp. NPDC087851]|uniref:hypothetical protein n=1 Tax=Streptomyces sp. NPDC087851 TaxID=3365810 RepID=UPI003819FE8D
MNNLFGLDQNPALDQPLELQADGSAAEEAEAVPEILAMTALLKPSTKLTDTSSPTATDDATSQHALGAVRAIM